MMRQEAEQDVTVFQRRSTIAYFERIVLEDRYGIRRESVGFEKTLTPGCCVRLSQIELADYVVWVTQVLNGDEEKAVLEVGCNFALRGIDVVCFELFAHAFEEIRG
jgi:hypothetical protein